MAVEEAGPVKRLAYLRLATKADVPVIKLLVEGLSEFEKQTHEFEGTEAAFESTIFLRPPFVGPTVFLLELGELPSSSEPSSPPPPPPTQAQPSSTEGFQEECREVTISEDVDDVKAALFISSKDRSRTVVGYVLFFPSYSTLLAKPGLFIGDFYVREGYRRQGFGTILLTAVARQAAKFGFGRVEWNVQDWNTNAIKFYKAMGANVLPTYRTCRLTGDELRAYGN